MDRFHAQGPAELQGEAMISGVESAALPILSAALPAEEPVEIQNVPELKDVDTSMKLPGQLGMKTEHNGSTYIDARDVNVFCTPHDLVKAMRASIWALGPLVAHFGQEQVSLSGGCTIGVRPVGLHISDLEQLGVTIRLEEGHVKASVGGRLKDAHIVMDKASVGATMTIMCAATLAEGTTIIEGAAREPEIVDTADFLITLGAKIGGQDTDRIVIEGVEHLGGGIYRILPDRIETGTSLAVVVISRGKIICRNTQPDTLDAVLVKLRGVGADTEAGEDWISLDMHGKRPKAVNVHTMPHPVFPTDIQVQFTLLNLVAEETGFITKAVSENRSMHVSELSHIDAHAKTENNTVICHDVEKLSGAQVMTTDLRASASLVPAGCVAERTAMADHTCHIDHGCERIEDKLRALDVSIECVKGK